MVINNYNHLFIYSSDISTKEFLLLLEEENQFGLIDLDSNHVLLVADEDVLKFIEKEVKKWQEKNI